MAAAVRAGAAAPALGLPTTAPAAQARGRAREHQAHLLTVPRGRPRGAPSQAQARLGAAAADGDAATGQRVLGDGLHVGRARERAALPGVQRRGRALARGTGERSGHEPAGGAGDRCAGGDRAGARLPARIVLDNGPEFRSTRLDVWAYEHQVALESSSRASRSRTR